MKTEIIQLAAEISMFVQDLSKDADIDILADQFAFEDGLRFEDTWDFAYADAIIHWRANGSPSNAFFSSADPIVICFKADLTKRFGLTVLDPVEAEAMERSVATKRVIVDGFGTGHLIGEVDSLAQRGRSMEWLKQNKMLN